MAELFLAATPIDETDAGAVTQQISQVFRQFGENPAQSSWVLAHFLGEGEWAWAVDIRKNAASIVAEAMPETDMPEPFFTETEPTEVFSDTTGATEEKLDTQTQNSPFREVTPNRDTFEEIRQSPEALETEFTKEIFSEFPDLPTEADFEKTLRERFSPQRLSTAMQTLAQYGREEGLRRLKESDPEIATHVERLIQPNKETD